MPATTRIVAARCTMTDLRLSFSRPNFGQIRVSSKPMKKITIGSAESVAAEASAIDGAKIKALR